MLNEIIEIQLTNTQIKGKITKFHPSELTIEILEPYSGLTNSSPHIMYSALGVKNYSGEYGLTTSKKLLKELFVFCESVEEKKHKVQYDFLVFMQEKFKSQSIIKGLKEQEKDLKALFKTTAYTEKEYQGKRRSLEIEILEVQENINISFNDFLTKYFAVTIPNGPIEAYLQKTLPLEGSRKYEYLSKHIFFGLSDLNDGFDVACISYFTEAQFEVVLQRVKEKRLVGIYGIEPWKDGEFFDVDTFENYKTYPQDPNWYFTSFEKFKKLGLDLQYSASFYVPGNCWI